MNIMNQNTSYQERMKLEKKALEVICTCYYYDLADTIDSMTDSELEEIVTNKGIDCDLCNED